MPSAKDPTQLLRHCRSWRFDVDDESNPDQYQTGEFTHVKRFDDAGLCHRATDAGQDAADGDEGVSECTLAVSRFSRLRILPGAIDRPADQKENRVQIDERCHCPDPDPGKYRPGRSIRLQRLGHDR